MKFLHFILFCFVSLNTYSNNIESPDKALQSIIDKSIVSFLELRKDDKMLSQKAVKSFIYRNLLQYFDADKAIQIVLKKNIDKFTPEQIEKLKSYLIKILIDNYVSFFTSYDKLDKVVVKILPNVQLKSNLALVGIEIFIDGKKLSNSVYIGIISDSHNWRIYDIIVSGVSFLRNYQAVFNNKIRYQGIDIFLDSIK